MVNGHAASAAARILARILPVLLPLQMSAERVNADEGPRPAFDWGANLRVRQEYLANAYDLSEAREDDHNYIRVRPQLWGSFAPSEHWKLFGMLTNEHRHWLKSNRGLEDADFEIHELIVENLWIAGTRLGGTPFGFVLGRQNLFYGDGFVAWDGGPLDGSRTAYFNALVIKAEFEKRRVEAHFISNPERDEYLPVANDQEQRLIERDETGAGVYLVDESLAGKKLEAYAFYKNEEDVREIYTIGGRASGSAADRLSFVAEGAVQLVSGEPSEGVAFGAQAAVKRTFPAFALSGGALYLSGTGYDRNNRPGWNPLYSRWPKWSDLYIYTLTLDSGAAYWSNIASPWLGVEVAPGRRISLELRARFLWAPEARIETCGPFCTAIPTWLSDDFDYRGTLASAKLLWKLSPRVGGHLQWEMLDPGGYYDCIEGYDAAHFLRWEMQFAY